MLMPNSNIKSSNTWNGSQYMLLLLFVCLIILSSEGKLQADRLAGESTPIYYLLTLMQLYEKSIRFKA